jgi:predicted dehydrogenase
MSPTPGTAAPADRPLGFAVAGLGGFAVLVAGLILDADPAMARLVGVGDPGRAGFAERAHQLEARGVAVADSFEEAAAVEGVDAVWLPVPIQWHRPMAEHAFAQGKAVLCEKPIAGCVADAEAMIAARDTAGRPGAVGFHDCFDPAVLQLKRALRDGECGVLESVDVVASWPRSRGYFTRSAWAGRDQIDGTAVRDSPANNALAHYLMLALLLLGDDDLTAAQTRDVRARTYRAADIETFDTVSARGRLASRTPWPDARWSLHLTHAGLDHLHPQLRLRGTRGTVLWKLHDSEPDAFAADRVVVSDRTGRDRIVPRFVALCRGQAQPDLPYATFDAAAAHARTIEQIHAACTPQVLTVGTYEAVPHQDTTEHRVVPGLTAALIAAANQDRLLPEDLADLPRSQ